MCCLGWGGGWGRGRVLFVVLAGMHTGRRPAGRAGGHISHPVAPPRPCRDSRLSAPAIQPAPHERGRAGRAAGWEGSPGIDYGRRSIHGQSCDLLWGTLASPPCPPGPSRVWRAHYAIMTVHAAYIRGHCAGDINSAFLYSCDPFQAFRVELM